VVSPAQGIWPGIMMKRIFEFFSKRSVLATLFTLAILILVLNVLRTIKRDQFPEVDFGQVIVTTAYPGASPEDVDKVKREIRDAVGRVTDFP
jgi:multidrug efflux pump subunit AcrB